MRKVEKLPEGYVLVDSGRARQSAQAIQDLGVEAVSFFRRYAGKMLYGVPDWAETLRRGIDRHALRSRAIRALGTADEETRRAALTVFSLGGDAALSTFLSARFPEGAEPARPVTDYKSGLAPT